MTRPLSLLFLPLLVFGLFSQAHAHPTVVFGELVSEPRTPAPGELFRLTLTLREPGGLAVEDAFVFAEFYRPGQAVVDDQGLRTDFVELEEGAYRAEDVTLPEAGTWTLKLRDRTYRQEETNARLDFVVSDSDAEANPTFFEFVFPPTRTPAESVLTWLLWLVGLPLLVALIVTAVVLAGSRGLSSKGQGGKSARPGKRPR